LASTALVAGVAGAGYAFVKLGEFALHTVNELQPIQSQLYALSGSLTQTKVDMQFVMETADRFGLKFTEIAKYFVELDMAARGTRLQGEGIRNMFVELAAVAGNFQMSTEKVAGMFNEMQRLLSMGIVQWRNLREVSRDIPNIYELISKAIGTDAVFALERFLKLGTQASDVIIPKLVAVIVKAYGIDVTRQVDTLAAAHARFTNALLTFGEALDKTGGFSTRAMHTYDLMRDTLTTLTSHIQETAKVVIVLTGALGGLAAGYLIAGLGRLATAIIDIGKAIATANALALTAGGTVAMLIKLAATAAGIAVAFSYLDTIIGKTGDAMLSGSVDIEAYIKEWDKLHKSTSSATDSMMTQVKTLQAAADAELTGTTRKLHELEDQYASLNRQLDEKPKVGWFQTASGKTKEIENNIAGIRAQMDALVNVQTGQIAQVEKYKALSLELVRIKGEQLKAEAAVKGIVTGDSDAILRQKEAEDKLKTALEGVRGEVEAIKLGPYAEQQAAAMAKVRKEVEAELDSLEKVGFTLNAQRDGLVHTTAQAALLDDMFKEWAVDLRRVAELKVFEKNFIEPWKVAEELLKSGMTTAVDQLITALEKGKVSWKDWSKIALDVINMVIKKMVELVAVIPLLNALFGEGTAGKAIGWTGGLGAGGLIGWLSNLLGGTPYTSGPTPGPSTTGGIGMAHGGTPISQYGTFPTALFAGAPRLHSGLGAGEYPAILQRGETVTPRGMTPGGAPVTINISHPPGTEADVQKNTTGGLDTYNVVITHVQKALSTGRLDLGIGGRYGFRPAGIRR
jgi:hypothetical protein